MSEPCTTLVDAIGGCSANIPADEAAVAYYITGPGIAWTAAQLGRFHGAKIPIDQSDGELLYPEHPILVLDVETGAKTLQRAVAQTRLRAEHKLQSVVYIAAGNYSLAKRTFAAADLAPDWFVANWNLSRAEAGALLGGSLVAIQYASPLSTPGVILPGTGRTIGEANVDLSVALNTWLGITATAAPKPKPKRSKARPHPKVAGASVGAALGAGIAAILHAAGVHINPEEASAISTLTAAITGTITPSRET